MQDLTRNNYKICMINLLNKEINVTKNKICPLLAMGRPEWVIGISEENSYCKKEKCAWWTNYNKFRSGCSLAVISQKLGG